MIGVPENDDLFMYHVKAEDFVPEDHPLRPIFDSLEAGKTKNMRISL